MKRRDIAWGLGLAMAGLAGRSAFAQAYPARQVHLVVTGTPGQGTDIVSRLIAQKLSERLKQQIVVENRAGAGGNIAAEYASKAPADGYTLLMATNATHAANPAMYARLPYDPTADFTPISLVGLLPMMISSSPALPVSNVREFVALARSKPGAINVAVPSSSARVVLELFNQLGKVELFPVSYKGSGPAFIDLFGGRIQATIDTVSATMPQIAGGKVKALAVSTARRFEAVPDVPTLAESGVGDFDLAPWNGLMAPRGTPREIVNLLNMHVAAILAEPDTRKRMVDLGIQPASGTPEQFDRFVQGEARKWGDLIRKANIKAE
ncbi:Bug family tripartite tricarboxylate transporter substrate binding protein [Ramlibacter sp.]|uniref:Bug family tripartite tricarboxylate transporter substrate binding protein n=1 Tax=Ramlibacter sp. TaxID=1917967 RepID=UPI003D11BDBA